MLKLERYGEAVEAVAKLLVLHVDSVLALAKRQILVEAFEDTQDRLSEYLGPGFGDCRSLEVRTWGHFPRLAQ